MWSSYWWSLEVCKEFGAVGESPFWGSWAICLVYLSNLGVERSDLWPLYGVLGGFEEWYGKFLPSIVWCWVFELRILVNLGFHLGSLFRVLAGMSCLYDFWG